MIGAGCRWREAAQRTSRLCPRILDPGRTTARRLLVTTGLVDELPDIPGLSERWAKDLLHCPYCHGWEVRDQAIGILAVIAVAADGGMAGAQINADLIAEETWAAVAAMSPA